MAHQHNQIFIGKSRISFSFYMRILALIVGVEGGLSGCYLLSTDSTEPAPYYAPYQWGFLNVSDTDLHEVNLYLDRHGQEVLVGFAGTLTPERPLDEGGKTCHTGETPQRVPDAVVIKWQTPDHESHRQDISLKSIVTEMGDFHGTLWLRYEDSKWRPMPLTESQMQWRVIHGHSAAPNQK